MKTILSSNDQDFNYTVYFRIKLKLILNRIVCQFPVLFILSIYFEFILFIYSECTKPLLLYCYLLISRETAITNYRHGKSTIKAASYNMHELLTYFLIYYSPLFLIVNTMPRKRMGKKYIFD